jgi:hypothetical protein
MKSRRAIFVVQMGWLIFLGAIALVRIIASPSKIGLPDRIGTLPVGVVWFGALGAVLISLTGIVEHAKDWDESFALWHLSRPLVGGSLAIVAVLIMQAGILAVGSSPVGTQPATPKNVLYYLVAFLVGYREETFREMIKRLVDLIFSPATAKQPPATGRKPAITAINPATGPAAGGTPVTIAGTGFVAGAQVTFGGTAATAVTVAGGGTSLTAVTPAHPAGAVDVEVVNPDKQSDVLKNGFTYQ